MNDGRVHPLVRSIAFRHKHPPDRIDAVERDDKIQHTLVWERDGNADRDSVKIPKYTFDRDGLSMGDPSVEFLDGTVRISVPIFADKDLVAKRFRRIQDISPTASNPVGTNWNKQRGKSYNHTVP